MPAALAQPSRGSADGLCHDGAAPPEAGRPSTPDDIPSTPGARIAGAAILNEPHAPNAGMSPRRPLRAALRTAGGGICPRPACAGFRRGTPRHAAAGASIAPGAFRPRAAAPARFYMGAPHASPVGLATKVLVVGPLAVFAAVVFGFAVYNTVCKNAHINLLNC